jgi:hypothetical protein
VDPHALLEWHLQEPERIRVPKLRLDPERLPGERLELDAEPLPQALALKTLKLRPRQHLELGLEDRHDADYSLSRKRQLDRPEGGGVRTTFIAIQEAGMTYLEVWTRASQTAELGDPGACRRR